MTQRGSGVESGGVLGDVVAVCGHQPESARHSAETLHHGGNCVRRVIVSGAAKVRQSAGNGKVARVVLRQAHFLTGNLHCRREAAIQIENSDVI